MPGPADSRRLLEVSESRLHAEARQPHDEPRQPPHLLLSDFFTAMTWLYSRLYGLEGAELEEYLNGLHLDTQAASAGGLVQFRPDEPATRP